MHNVYICTKERSSSRSPSSITGRWTRKRKNTDLVEQEFREVSTILKTMVTNQAPRLLESNCKKFADWIATELEKMPEERSKLKMQEIVKIIYE